MSFGAGCLYPVRQAMRKIPSEGSGDGNIAGEDRELVDDPDLYATKGKTNFGDDYPAVWDNLSR